MRSLEDLNYYNSFSQLPEIFYSEHQATPLSDEFLVHFNPVVAELIGLDKKQSERSDFLDFFTHNQTASFKPLAACYAGHQFGHFVPRLGDGRAILLAQIQDQNNQPWDLQLKGAGPTLYSRGSDGRAVLRSSIREYLCSAAMHGLHIPTTHALFLSSSKHEVYREQIEPGAMILRVASSHIRFGSFEYYFYSQRFDDLKILTDYVLQQYFPQLLDSPNPVLALLDNVIASTASMIANWQAVGFAHGVMNTDNMSIHGETLDYGPFGFIEQYDPTYICNHSDHHGRYAFNKQPEIALFNLSCLAQALLPVLHEEPDTAVELAKHSLSKYQPLFEQQYTQHMQKKLGLYQSQDNDRDFIQQTLNLLESNKVDYTLFFRSLSQVLNPQEVSQCRDLFLDRDAFDNWITHYQKRLQQEKSISLEDRSQRMKRVNPKYILRNYMAEIAIRKAQDENDYTEINTLMEILQDPFSEHSQFEHYAGHPPDWAQQIEVSCSS